MSHFVFQTHSNVMALYHPEQAMPSICSGSNCFTSCADYRNARKLWVTSQTHGCKWDLPASIWQHSDQCSYFLPHSDLPPYIYRLPKKLIQCQQHTVKMEEETVPKSLADNFILTHKTQMQFFISWYLLWTAWERYSSIRASRTTFGLLLCTTGVHHWWSHSRS
jgi:hypothetical protein